MKDPISTNQMFVCAVISLAVAAPLLLLLLHNFLSLKNKTNSRRLPPGPPCWPLIRLDVGYDYKVPHKRLVEIQKKYGPIFMMRMGKLNMLVIASADAAMELLKTHHQAFINRHLVQRLQPVDDKKFKATAWAPYGGPIWRISRRLYGTLFSRTTMNNTLGKRRQFVDQMLQWILVEQKEGRSVEIKHLTLVTFVNLLGNLFFSKDVMDLKSATGSELYQLLGEIVVVSSKLNVADLFPWVRNLDSQNLANRMKTALYAFENIVDVLAKERRITHVVHNSNEEKDYWDLLMDFEGNGKDEPEKLSDRYITSFITEMFVTGTDSIMIPLEWVMTEVVRNPEVMRKAKDEIYQVVGYKRKIEESDIESLPYLAAVIKETLRLHPPSPFLVPRTTVEDTEFMGYIIPKDTAVLVNLWGIGRDSALWDDPLSFNPDRFLRNTNDNRGQHFRLLPFGAGRRICAGIPLVNQIIPIVVGSLLQSFDWTLENGGTPESIDMNETSLKKSIPLRIIPKASALAV
ncbi:hypothetical protein MKW98_021286 [Papaver atlanticum]|uniref:N-methylcoclaurine 3'-monooxygenase n=1 Tax=Papaver atlanticum TaxID=357466 RepID=A0AAD4SPR6_9MAGN|nr:hypothetical protein MKW98_021286 [Papaver atlanticum]